LHISFRRGQKNITVLGKEPYIKRKAAVDTTKGGTTVEDHLSGMSGTSPALDKRFFPDFRYPSSKIAQ
jgi:hypothetical protein